MAGHIRRRTIVSKTLPLVGVILLLLAASLLVQQSAANRHAEDAASKAVALANAGISSQAPATTKPTPTAIDTYTVPSTRPRYLLIPSLAVKARVMAVGVTKDNAIGAPNNVHDTAWYTGSSLPGKPGASLIDGHVSSWKTEGVFYNLHKLRPGDAMQVQLGNGSVVSYTVVKTQSYAAADIDVATLLTPIETSKPGLNLITCSGDVIKGTNEFSRRLVVYASQN